MRKLIILVASILLFGACGSVLNTDMSSVPKAPAGGEAATKTLENLQTAFNGESNANAKYLAFAKKADEEGYARVASLFRAAARAEAIHIANHSQVIKQLGATPAADIKPPEVKTTAENLRAAIDGETYERDKMYPEFLDEARRANNRDAVRTFNLAKAAEAEHAKLYSDALANLDKWKAPAATFYVCPMCGYTAAQPVEKCPVDFTPKDKFEAIQ